MSRIVKITLARLLLAVSLLSLVLGCAPNYDTIDQTVDQASQGTTPSQTVAVNANPAPRWVQLLEVAGFSVFNPPRPLPAFSVTNLDGIPTTIDSVAGKLVLLNFWATWCPPCRAEMPSIQNLQDELSAEPFTVFAISVGESATTVRLFLAEFPYTFPMYLDTPNDVGSVFASRGIPTTYILDKQGRALGGFIGSQMYDTPAFLQMMRELIEILP